MSASSRRKALVTGTSTGLGKEIALGLARDGYDVAFADRDAAMLDDVMALPELADVKAVPVTLELTSENSIKDGLNAAIEGLGGLDVVVNNAALALIKPVVDVTWDDWDRLVSVNLKGAYFLSARFAEHCISIGQPGAIVNIASTHGLTGIAGRSVYGVTKGGLIQMTRMLAIEWVEQGIRVNTVAPTTVMTESRQEMLKDPATRKRMLSRIPVGHFPDPSEIAGAVRYLAAVEQVSVTGQVLAVDGGLTAA